MPRYIIELFDHRTKTTIVEYSEGTNMIDAVLMDLDGENKDVHISDMEGLRARYMNNDIQFIGAKIDPFVCKINTERKQNEVPKSVKRSDNKKQKNAGRKSSFKHHR